MKSDLDVVFNFMLSQWSLSPQTFKEAIIDAVLAKFVLSLAWWITRFLAARFPKSAPLMAASRGFNTAPAKLIVLILDVTLIDVFLFFGVLAAMDLSRHFTYFSLWSVALFTFLFVYMLMLAHKDLNRYELDKY